METKLAQFAQQSGRQARQTGQSGKDTEKNAKAALALPKDEHFERQVVSYKAWLATQTQRHNDTVYHDRQSYAERAMQAVEIGDKRIQTFAPFRYKYSALQTITHKQIAILVIFALLWVVGMVWNWRAILAGTISLITLGYLSHLILDVYVALRAVHHPSEEHIDNEILDALKDADWPPYTILCPLYKEARVVPQFVQAMKAIDYPADKLQILFLTEEDDTETRKAILTLNLPQHFFVITVPDGSPRTKPRACNYGLIEATGEYVVIYDAEDVPDPLQLKKAVLTFANHGPDIACVQAKLNFYNPEQNLLTRWFTAEYSLWFDLILPGLQKANLAIPLGGTSNHFPTQTLRALGGWDGYNVTEDCDLGLRLSWFRLKTVIVDSTTYEEANSNVKNWIRQRSRWIKGYMQTYLVHMREPLHYLRNGKLRELFSLQVLVGGKTAVLLINPFMWLLLALTLAFHQVVWSAFASLFPPFILYIGAITLTLGNFFYGYIYLLGCMKREQYSLVKWMLLIPAYWFLASVAASMALYELCTRPHYWQKTVHGLHIKKPPTAESDESGSEWDTLAKLAESLTPLTSSKGPSLEHGTGFAAQVQHYTNLQLVPVASVQDSVATMVVHHKPALLPSEQAYLERRKRVSRDVWFAMTLLTATTLSILACIYFLKQNQLLLFPMALDQLTLARHFVMGASPLNFTLLGPTALPLPYLLMAPFAWNDYLWHTGLAGSIPSMLCYIVTAVYVFLTVRTLTHNSIISYLGACIFLLNPVMLYLQSVPLSEMLALATFAMVGYYLLAWTQSNKLSHLIGAAAGICLATLTRYDAWLCFALLFMLVLGTGWVKRQPRVQITSSLLVFGILGGLGMLLWCLWNWTVVGNPIAFIIRPHPVFLAVVQPSSHTFQQTLNLYQQMFSNTFGLVLGIPALVGLLVFILRWGRGPEMIAALGMLTPIILHIAILSAGLTLFVLPLPVPFSMQDALLKTTLEAELVVPAAIFFAASIGAVYSLLGRQAEKAIPKSIH